MRRTSRDVEFDPSGNRPLSKLAYGSEMQGAYGAQNRNVLINVHEDSSTGATQQFTAEVEFGKGV